MAGGVLAAAHVGRAVGVVLRPLVWPFRRPGRLLWLAWLVGFFLVGHAAAAYADDFIVGPGGPTGAAPTPFEAVPLSAYSLPIILSDPHHGAPYVEQTMWNMLGAVSNVLMYLVLALMRGAIVCMQWMLQLDLFQENKYQIDSAVMSLGNQVFWPLFGTTLAIAGVVMYGRMKREGGGSIFNDVVWCLSAGVLAVTLAGIPGSQVHQDPAICKKFGPAECYSNPLGPSTLFSDVDNLRRGIGVGVIEGFSSSSSAGTSAAGFPDTTYTSGQGGDGLTMNVDQVNAVRKLANSMWNVYAVTPWCYAMYGSTSVCSAVDGAGGNKLGEGAAYLLRSGGYGLGFGDGRTIWPARSDYLTKNSKGDGLCPSQWNPANDAAGSYKPGGATVGGETCNWIRGQSFARLGSVVFLTLTSLPMALLLLALVLFGVMAVVGFILLLLTGLIFLLGWMIPGRMRQIGIKWFEAVLATLIQSIIITTVLGGVMVLSAMLNNGLGRYGYFMVIFLNVAIFIVGFRLRGQFESITHSPASASPVSQYMAMKMLSGAGRAGRRVARLPSAPGRAAASIERNLERTKTAGRMAGQVTGLRPLARAAGPRLLAAFRSEGAGSSGPGRIPSPPRRSEPRSSNRVEGRYPSAPMAQTRPGPTGSRPADGAGRRAGSSDPSGSGGSTRRIDGGGTRVDGAVVNLRKQSTVSATRSPSSSSSSPSSSGGSDRYAPTRGLRPLSTATGRRTAVTPVGSPSAATGSERSGGTAERPSGPSPRVRRSRPDGPGRSMRPRTAAESAVAPPQPAVRWETTTRPRATTPDAAPRQAAAPVRDPHQPTRSIRPPAAMPARPAPLASTPARPASPAATPPPRPAAATPPPRPGSPAVTPPPRPAAAIPPPRPAAPAVTPRPAPSGGAAQPPRIPAGEPPTPRTRPPRSVPRPPPTGRHHSGDRDGGGQL